MWLVQVRPAATAAVPLCQVYPTGATCTDVFAAGSGSLTALCDGTDHPGFNAKNSATATSIANKTLASALATCCDCPAGSQLGTDNTTCTSCPTNTITDAANQSNCSACASPLVASAANTTCVYPVGATCENPDGDNTTAAASICTSNTPFTANASSNSISINGSTFDTAFGICCDCPAGNWLDTNGTCNPCINNTITHTLDQANCTACASPLVANSDRTACECPAGYTNSTGNCTLCAANTFSTAINRATACDTCPASTASNLGRTACVPTLSYTQEVVNGGYVIVGATVRYTIVLTNGPNSLSDSDSLTLNIASSPTVAATLTACTVGGTTVTMPLTKGLAAYKALVCTLDVPVTTGSSIGTFNITAMKDNILYGSEGSALLTVPAVSVYTPKATLTVSSEVTSANSTYVTVNGAKLPVAGAVVTYTITMTNGGTAVPAGTALTLVYTPTTAPAITGAVAGCTVAGAAYTLGANLPTGGLAAGAVLACTMNATVSTSHLNAGELAAFSVEVQTTGSVKHALAVSVPAVATYVGPKMVVTSAVTSGSYVTVDGTKLAKEDAVVTYTITLTNGNNSLAAATMDADRLKLVFRSYDGAAALTPAPVPTCSVGSTAFLLPSNASLAANTNLVCTYAVSVSADDVTAGELQGFMVEAVKGTSTWYAGNVTVEPVQLYTPPLLSISQHAVSGPSETVGSQTMPKEGATVSYTVTLTNGDITIIPGNTLTLVSLDPSYTASSCTILGTAVTNPMATGLAPLTSMVCTFTVSVTADHVSAGSIPSFAVRATLDSMAVDYVAPSSGDSVRPYSATAKILSADGAVKPGQAVDTQYKVVNGQQLAVAGGVVQYTINLANGAKELAAGSKLDLTFSPAMPAGTVVVCTVGDSTFQLNNNATSLAANAMLVCKVDRTVAASDVTNKQLPSFTVTAKLGNTSADYAAAVTVDPVPLYAGQQSLTVVADAVDVFDIVDGERLAKEGGSVQYTITLVNGNTSISGSANNLTVATSLGGAAALVTSCEVAGSPVSMPLTTGLSADTALVCTMSIAVTAAQVQVGALPGFTVNVLKGSTAYASKAVPKVALSTGASLAVTSTITSGASTFVTANGVDLPKEGAVVTYTAKLINGIAPLVAETDTLDITSSLAEALAPTSCQVGGTTVHMPLSRGLAARAALVCYFDVTVSAAHVSAGRLPTFSVAAVKQVAGQALGFASSVPVESQPVYTTPSLAVGSVVTSGSYVTVDGAKLADVGAVITYTVTLTNGATFVFGNSSLTLAFVDASGATMTPTALSCKANGGTVTLPLASDLDANQQLVCSFTVTVAAEHKAAGALPAFQVKATWAADGTTTTDYVPALSVPAVRVHTDDPSLDVEAEVTDGDYVTVDGKKLAKEGARVTYTITLTNGDAAVTSPNLISLAFTDLADVALVPAPAPLCTVVGGSAFVLGSTTTGLAINKVLQCVFNVTVGSYEYESGSLPGFKVQAKKGTSAAAMASYGLQATVPPVDLFTTPTVYVRALVTAGTTVRGPGYTMLPTEGATVTYSVYLSNGDAPLAIGSSLSLFTSLAAVPSLSTCSVAGSAVDMPLATGLAAGTYLQCTFDVTVDASHVAAGELPAFTVRAAVGAAEYAPLAYAAAEPVYTEKPTLTASHTVGGGRIVNGQLIPDVGGVVTYTISLLNGVEAVAEGLTLNFTNIATPTTLACTVDGSVFALPSTAELGVSNLLVCTFGVSVTSTHKANGTLPGFLVKATRGADVVVVDYNVTAVPVYIGAAGLAVVSEVDEAVGNFEIVDGQRLAKEGGLVQYTITLVNGATAVPTTANLTISTSLGVAMSCRVGSVSAAVGNTATTLPLRTGLPADTALVCSFSTAVTAAHVQAGALPGFTVSATKSVAGAIATAFVDDVAVPALAVFTGPTLVVASAITSGPDTYVTLNTTALMAKEGATVTYSLTLTNGATAVPIGQALSIVVANLVPVPAVTCDLLNTTVSLPLATGLPARTVLACSFSVAVTASHASAGEVPALAVSVTKTVGGVAAKYAAAQVAAVPVYVPPPQGLPENPAYNNISVEVGKPVVRVLHFEGASFDDLEKSADAMASFKDSFTTDLATSLGIAKALIKIASVTRGSVVVQFEIDTTSMSSSQLQQLVGKVDYNTGDLFSPEFLSDYGITDIKAVVLQPAAGGLNIPAVVGGVVGGVGGALLVAAVAFVVISRRRKAAVEPRGHAMGEGVEAVVAPLAAGVPRSSAVLSKDE